ncbi:MAG: RNA methyltransferase [Candidatus Omnitrophica bacterium]|nr:RNA methyltransferase [Candidatus Omnitrophota bacterium]
MKHGLRLYGKGSVVERLRAQPESVRKIVLRSTAVLPEITQMAETHRIRIEALPAGKFDRLCRMKNIQGVFADVQPFAYADYYALAAAPEPQRRVLVFLEGITDPHNFGVMLRAMACFGGFAAVIPAAGACEINETVLHVSAGGDNYVPVSRVSDLTEAVQFARERRYQIVGAIIAETGRCLYEAHLSFPLGIVLGAERRGVSPALTALLDAAVYIPMRGVALSLNVNNACAIFCYEAARRRDKDR